MNQPFDRAGIEPSLEEAIADPVVRLVMRRDGLSDADVWCAVRYGRGRLGLGSKPAGECQCSRPQSRSVTQTYLKCA